MCPKRRWAAHQGASDLLSVFVDLAESRKHSIRALEAPGEVLGGEAAQEALVNVP